MKKLDRNVENIFSQCDHSNNNNGNTPHWLSSLTNANGTNGRKKDFYAKAKNDDFSLPNLPGGKFVVKFETYFDWVVF